MPTLRAKPERKKPGAFHHGNLREELLAAAADALEKNGANALSLRALARRLGVSHGAPAKHFENREALLAALAARGFQRLNESVGAAAAGADDKMRARGLGYVRFALKHPALYQLMFSDMIHDWRHPALIAAAQASFAGLEQAVGGSPGAREARGDAALAAWAFVHGLAQLLIGARIPAHVAAGRKPEEIAQAVLGLSRRR